MPIIILEVLRDGAQFATILAQDESDAGKMMSALADAASDQDDDVEFEINVKSPDDFQDVLERINPDAEEEDPEDADEEDDEPEDREDDDEDEDQAA
jgi:hypothetical protein